MTEEIKLKEKDMKYKINSKFVDYNKKKSKDGMSLNLVYELRERDDAGNSYISRQGNTRDLDGIISILLECGALEDVDSEEDEDDLVTAMRMIIGSGYATIEKIEPKAKDSEKDFNGLSAEQLEEMKSRLNHYEKIINDIHYEKDRLLCMLKTPSKDEQIIDSLEECINLIKGKNT